MYSSCWSFDEGYAGRENHVFHPAVVYFLGEPKAMPKPTHPTTLHQKGEAS